MVRVVVFPLRVPVKGSFKGCFFGCSTGSARVPKWLRVTGIRSKVKSSGFIQLARKMAYP